MNPIRQTAFQASAGCGGRAVFPMIGKMLKQYRIIEKLGSGGHGVV